ncbi:hypothetical protein B0H66DRAFT_551114 [Apodospora peruviana]|uniref:Rhodopsin domain-containing protein n=1 Tax=Apodospora peruviana TaxID=516989 RepID=A0AAE0MCC6_9PEZI|nr:hypothetical protein B0H66DRAFT_551114 [Apodospora peruviana]
MEFNLDGPTIPPPEGLVPTLDNPPNGNHAAIAIITICVILTAVCYPVRFYAKYLNEHIGVADYLSFVAFPLFWVYVYFSYRLSWTPGYLIHMWDIRLGEIANFTYVCFVATLLYLWIIALVKCAILLEWTSIFAPDGKHSFFAWACYAACGTIALLSAIIFIMDLVNCTPFEGNWNPLVPGGAVCRFAIPEFGLASSVTNLLLDMVPLVLAQRVIWGLRMSWKRKLGISAVFLIGILACVAGIVRLYYATRFYSSNDTSYFFSIMALCSLCETTCAHLVLCVPFCPKAMTGLQKSRAVTELKKYMSLPSYATGTTKNSDAGGAFQDSRGMELHPFSNKSTPVNRTLGSAPGSRRDEPKCSEDSDKAVYQWNPV